MATRSWALVASIIVSVAGTVVVWVWTALDWALDPCGGGGLAARCEDGLDAGRSNGALWALGATVVLWWGTTWVARQRGDPERSTATLLAIGVGAPVACTVTAMVLVPAT